MSLDSSAASAAPAPVTVVVTRLVAPGREADFERWQERISRAAMASPGHLGVTVLRPQSEERLEYVVIFRFDGYDNLRVWMGSATRRALLAESKSFTLSDPEIQVLEGLEGWFSLPRRAQPAARYKIAVVSCLAIYPQVQVFGPLVGWLAGGLPGWLQSLLVTALVSIATPYAIMPAFVTLFWWWLYPEPAEKGAPERR